ncbi:MAG: fumarylacetoacetate hydrolase family protein [Bacteroidota bacterium]
MKIICIGRNYSEHAKELNNDVPKEPVFFMKPETALLKENDPFYYPEFTSDLHHEIEIVLKICKTGKYIEEKFAHLYYDEIGIGIDFTARDLQQDCKKNGLPWEKAKAFDHSAPISKFISKSEFTNLANIDFSLLVKEKLKQKGNTCDLIFSFDNIIAYVSRFVTLKTGDLIFTGTPQGVGPVKRGDVLEGFIGDKKMLTTEIR